MPQDGTKLKNARAAKNDEFYTRMVDIEKELPFYRHHFENKIIYCNCDDPSFSQFWQFFKNNFAEYKLKHLQTTYYNRNGASILTEYDGSSISQTNLKYNGDFRTPECQNLLAESDIVVSNPPFSLFGKYVKQLLDFGVDFLVIGNAIGMNMESIRDAFLKREFSVGRNRVPEFTVPDHYTGEHKVDENGIKTASVNSFWYTSMEGIPAREPLELTAYYGANNYEKYDNYDAIDVPSVSMIPKDYDGDMGVPVTYLIHHDPNQFELIGFNKDVARGGNNITIRGKDMFSRVIIRRI